jgi:beta-barrel assembly-enhancing protease
VSGGQHSFVAEAFSAALGGEALAGRIVLDRRRLRFESPAFTLEILLTQLQIDMDESTAGRICFRDPGHQDWTICTFDPRILEHGALRQQPHTRSQIRELQGSSELKRRLKLTLGVLGAFAVVAIMVSVLTGMMVRALVARVPLRWEQELGDKLLQEVKAKKTFLEDARLMARLTNAVAPLVTALPKGELQYRFYIMEERLPNAFALPGGHVVMTTGLMDLADRPEELAGVAAHEIAHVTQRHLFRKIVSSAGPLVICGLFAGGQGGLLGMLGAGSQLLIAQGFSQEYELEADALGWDYLLAARINPRAMPDMLRKLEAAQVSLGKGPEVQAFSTHPATEKRVQRLEARWRRLKNKSGFIQFEGAAPGANP